MAPINPMRSEDGIRRFVHEDRKPHLFGEEGETNPIYSCRKTTVASVLSVTYACEETLGCFELR